MTRPPFTASQIDVVRACLGAAVLPRTKRRTTPGMKWGTLRHRFLQRCNELGGGEAGRAKALAEIKDPAIRYVFEAIELTGLPLDPSAYVAELAVAWNFETGKARELHRGGDRDYSMLTETEVCGTADAAALVGDDAIFCGDYKSQWAFLAPVAELGQMQFLGMAIARTFRSDRSLIEIIRPRKDAPAWRDVAELDAFDLSAIAEEMRSLALQVVAARLAYERDGELPELHPGEQCARCECTADCPAIGGALAQLVDDRAPDPVERFKGLLPTKALAAMKWLEAAETRLGELKQALRDYATNNPIDMGDGRVYGLQRRNQTTITGKVVWHVLAEMFDAETAWKIAEVKIVQDKLKDVLRPIAEASGRKLAHLEREVRERSGDGWRISTRDELRVHRAGKGQALLEAGEDGE